MYIRIIISIAVLIASDLIQLAKTLSDDAGKTFSLLVVAVQSTIAADSAAMQVATISEWMNERYPPGSLIL